jgi:hypothetical protein
MSKSDSPEGSTVSEEPSIVQTGRRSFLRLAGFAFAAVALPDSLSGCGSSPAGGGEKVGAVANTLDLPITNPWIDVFRSQDFLRLRLNFVQMSVQSNADGGTGTLVLDSPSSPGVILLEFPPQHIIEPTVPEPPTGAPTSVPSLPIDARISDTTRLAFLVPAGTPPIPYDLEDLLARCASLDLNVATNAVAASDDTLPAPSLSLTAPAPSSNADNAVTTILSATKALAQNDVSSDTLPAYDFNNTPGPAPSFPVPPSQTAIELPYRVLLSPGSSLRFAHSPTPYTSSTSSLTELWTSRLARKKTVNGAADETTRVPVSMRAISANEPGLTSLAQFDGVAPNPSPYAPADPFPEVNMALPGAARMALLRQSGDLRNPQTRPFHARRLLLSARGGSLDTLADFGDDPQFDLATWQHRAAVGRDNYVRVEFTGVLFPYWHEASLVTISERKFLANPSGAGPRTAYVWSESFLLIRQPLMAYQNGSLLQQNWPFQQIRILTPSTPPLDTPPTQPAPFWPTINNVAFRFAAEFVDLDGNVSTSNLAAIWVPDSITPDYGSLQTQFQTASDGVGTGLRCTSNFQRQRVAYAPTYDDATTTGKTTFETQHIAFGANLTPTATPPPPAVDAGSPPPPVIQARILALPFNPIVSQTEINIPSARQFTGVDQVVVMEYPAAYLAASPGDSWANNPGEAFLSVATGGVLAGSTPAPLAVDFGAQSQRAGGFMTPNISIIGLSRQIGPISGALASVGGAPPVDVGTQISNFASSATADPSLLFGAIAGTKLFGVFTLGELFGNSLKLPSMPSFATKVLDAVSTLVKTLDQAQDAIQELQSAAASIATPPPALANVLSQVNGFQSSVAGFIQAASAVPTAGVAGATTAIGQLSTLGTSVGAIQLAVSVARSANVTATAVQSLADSTFATADKVLQSAQSMLSSGNVGEISGAIQGLAGFAQAAQNLSSTFTWQTKPGDIQPISVGPFNDVFNPSPPSGASPTLLKLTGEVRAHEVAGKPAGLDLTATLNNFDINLLGIGGTGTPNNPASASPSALAFMALSFDHLTFSYSAGQKPDVDVGLNGLTFEGPLTFLNALKSIIPLDGFGDPPGITVDASGITAEFTLALPSLAVGIFALENISLGANLDIPFIGEPMTVGFHFSERENPFHLTVCFLGGGGYFLMDLSMQGVVLIEAALEFGAEASVNFVVASGSVLVMAGIYFSYTPSGVTLTGYVRIAGSLSVLGLITASVELRLDLGYRGPTPPTAFGQATISIEVSICFFSESVDVSCEKSFSSCNGDPTFVDAMGPDSSTSYFPWNEYCAAFAA